MQIKKLTANLLLLATLANPLSSAFAASASPRMSDEMRIQNLILQSKIMQKKGANAAEIGAYVAKELSTEGKVISVESMKNFIALKHGYQSAELKRFEQINQAVELSVDENGANPQILEGEFSKILAGGESKASPFLGNFSCWAPYAGIFGVLGGLVSAGLSFTFDKDEFARVHMAGYNLSKSEDVLSLQTNLSNKIIEANVRKQRIEQLVKSPITLDLAINELRMQKENGLLKVDAASLVYMRAENISTDGFSIFGFSTQDMNISYSGSSTDLYKSVNSVIDVNTELRRLESYREIVKTYGADGAVSVATDNEEKLNTALNVISSSKEGQAYQNRENLKAEMAIEKKRARKQGIIITSAVTVGIVILVAAIGETDCDY